LSYRLLWLYYVQAQSQQATCRELGLSERSFYRRLQEAVEAVASILWEQRCGAEVAVSQAGETALDAAGRMRSEALQRQPSHRQRWSCERLSSAMRRSRLWRRSAMWR
jgi:hypothetical protein